MYARARFLLLCTFVPQTMEILRVHTLTLTPENLKLQTAFYSALRAPQGALQKRHKKQYCNKNTLKANIKTTKITIYTCKESKDI